MPNVKKNVLIVTYIDFWRGGAGHIARLSALIGYLSREACVTVAYIGPCFPNDKEIIREHYEDVNVHFLEEIDSLTAEGYINKFREFIRGRVYDVVVLEYIELAIALDYISKASIRLLDTHDIVSDKIESFVKANLSYNGLHLTFEQELDIFRKFDGLILISSKDYGKIEKYIDKDKLLLMPHPVNYPKQTIRKIVKNISFIASNYTPNVLAIKWFIKSVWPEFSSKGIILNLYGYVGKELSEEMKTNNVYVHGFIDDLSKVYREADVVINPVACGAGLKIKNLEALGNGLPLVTTSHGASGLEKGYPDSYLVADTAEEFIRALNSLINDFSLRKKLSFCSYNYTRTDFSVHSCFQAIDKFL